MKTMIIYKTTNLINGKCYIGQDSHNDSKYLGSGIAINKAIEKYGRENFIKEELAICYTKEHLNFLEKFYINFYNTKRPRGYNCTDGGDGVFGGTPWNKGKHGHLSVLQIKKLSESHIGKQTGKKHPMYGKHHSVESIKKQSDREKKDFKTGKRVVWNEGLSGGWGWNRGLRKETDERVKQYGLKESKTKQLIKAQHEKDRFKK